MSQRNELIDKAEDVADQVLHFRLCFNVSIFSKITFVTQESVSMLSYVMKYCNSVCLIEHIEKLKLFDNDSILFFIENSEYT